MDKTAQKPWYVEWFDSPYYDLLYRERDQEEADAFIRKLVDFLKPSAGSLMLDIACGKGRHAISLNRMGYNVTGFDLSEKNICAAKIHETTGLAFYIHDMRKPFMINYYDIIFNLFTSFGYFEKESDNDAVLHNIYNALKPGGTFVIDFMNMEKTLLHLLAYEEKQVSRVNFKVAKSINKEHFLVKHIHVEDGGMERDFEEKIKIFTEESLKKRITDSGFKIVRTFGDYELHDFNNALSDRLIIICKKSS